MTDLRSDPVAPSAPSAASTAGLTPPSERGFSSRLIGDVAVELGYASREAVDAAVADGRALGRTTGSMLLESGALTPEQLARVVAERFGLDHVDLLAYPVDERAVSLVEVDVLRRYEAVPIGFADDRTLLVAMSEPSNVLAADDLSVLTGYSVRIAIASPEAIDALLHRLERGVDGPASSADQVAVARGADAEELRRNAGDAPIVRLVHSIIEEAIEHKASDIHFAPQDGELHGQFRVDGVLVETTTIPKHMAPGVISRIKVMADLDITERRVPQDGRMTVTIDRKPVDLRVVTLPLVGGESIVMRVLDRREGILDLDDLGLAGEERDRFLRACQGHPGAVLVTGPTGSGKTTTLYAALDILNTGERSILTIEDPVEARMDGIKQMQVDDKVGVTFASGLRSMLRADPDVVMVGEMRDREAAQIGIEAALTGHLVLSTLHTNDAPSAVSRLLEMGVAPFLVADALRCVIAQRLVRRLCPECREPVVLDGATLRASGFDVDADVPGYTSTGCGRCGGSGYRGRVGLYEVMEVGPHLNELIMRRAPGAELAAAAVAHGMRRLRDDGLDKVRAGVTSIAEVSRVLGRN